MSFLEAFWQGEITPGEGRYRPNYGYAKPMQIMEQAEAELKVALSQEEWNLFQQYTEALQTVSSLSDCENFIEGFRMGARMMMDVLVEPK